MKGVRLTPLTVIGLTVAAVIVLVGGWMLLDMLLGPFFVAEGSRSAYQEISRKENMDRPLTFLGADRCGECHPAVEEEWSRSVHGTVICEDCHDPGRAHVEEAQQMTINASSALCLICHTNLTGRPADFPQVEEDAHSEGLRCTECHSPMHPEPAEAPRRGHVSYQGIDCLVCHGGDSVQPAPADHDGRSLASCARCHEEEGDNQ